MGDHAEELMDARRRQPRLELVAPAAPAPARGWWESHALNRPSWREVWAHSWPWLVVAAMLVAAGCRAGLALPLVVLAVIGLLALRRPRR